VACSRVNIISIIILCVKVCGCSLCFLFLPPIHITILENSGVFVNKVFRIIIHSGPKVGIQ